MCILLRSKIFQYIHKFEIHSNLLTPLHHTRQLNNERTYTYTFIIYYPIQRQHIVAFYTYIFFFHTHIYIYIFFSLYIFFFFLFIYFLRCASDQKKNFWTILYLILVGNSIPFSFFFLTHYIIYLFFFFFSFSLNISSQIE